MRLDQTPAKALSSSAIRRCMVDWCTLNALAAACMLPARGVSKKLSHDEHAGSAMAANSRVTRCAIVLAVYFFERKLRLEIRRDPAWRSH